jgi:chromosome partitioning protein
MRIAIAAHKGGAGKTTLAVNMSAAIAAAGQPVLLIDADPQGAATAALGVKPGAPTLYQVLKGEAQLAEAIRPSRMPRLSIVPATLDLAGAEIELPMVHGWQLALRDVLANERERLVVIDTPPGLGVLAYAALAAVERVVIACPPEYLSLRSLANLATTVSDVAQSVAPNLRVLGIVPTMTTRRSRHEREALEALAENYGSLLLPEIPRRVVIQDAAAAGQPITVYAPASGAAGAFRTLAAEVMRRVQQGEPAPA